MNKMMLKKILMKKIQSKWIEINQQVVISPLLPESDSLQSRFHESDEVTVVLPPAGTNVLVTVISKV